MAPLKWNLIFIFCFVVRKMTFFLWKASKLLRIRSNSEESLCRTEWSRSSSREDSVKIIYDVCSWHVLLSKPSSPKWNVYWWRRCGRSLCECDYRERGLSWLKHWDVSETLRREQQLLRSASRYFEKSSVSRRLWLVEMLAGLQRRRAASDELAKCASPHGTKDSRVTRILTRFCLFLPELSLPDFVYNVIRGMYIVCKCVHINIYII